MTAAASVRGLCADVWREQVLSGIGCLQRGQWLCQDSLRSPSGRFTLSHLPDGELQLTGDDGQVHWAVGSAGIPAGGLTLMPDGDLVLFDAHDWPVWSSGTAGVPTEWLLVTDDAALVLLDSSCRVRWRLGG